jgi:hypothetical protein
MYQQRPSLHLVIDGPSIPVGADATAAQKRSNMSEHTMVDEKSTFEQLTANLKILSSDVSGVPQQLADAVAQAGLQATTGTIAFAGRHSSGDYAVQYNDQNGGFSSAWPQWAFELAKAALLANKRVWVASNGDPFGSNLAFVMILS